MPRRKVLTRSTAILVARRADDTVVERHELPLDAYYDELHELTDNPAYRAARGIAELEASLFDRSGKLFQEFRNRYAADGSFAGNGSLRE